MQQDQPSLEIQNSRKNKLHKYREKLVELYANYLHTETEGIFVCRKIPPENNIFATFQFMKNHEWQVYFKRPKFESSF